jgi:hypothetical protein
MKRKERVVIAYSLEQKAVIVSFLLRLHEGDWSTPDMPARNRFKISVSQTKLNKIYEYNFYRQLLHEILTVIIILDIFPFASG